MRDKKLKWLIVVFVVLLCVGVSKLDYGYNEKDAEIYAEDLMKVVTGQELETINTGKYWDIESVEDIEESYKQGVDVSIDKLIESLEGFDISKEERERLKDLSLN